MVDLPWDCLQESPPFIHHGIDMSHKGDKKYLRLLWSPVNLFDKLCHPY